MKKIIAVVSVVFLGGLLLFLRTAQAANPNPDVGKPCTLSNGSAGTIQLNTSQNLVCRQSNPGNKAPLEEPINESQLPSNNNSGSGSFSSGGTGQYAGTCADLNEVMSSGFVRQVLCQGGGNAVEAIVRNLSNYILSLAMIVLTVLLGIGFVQVMTGGGSPEALKAGKKRITLALSSIALFVLGRLVLDLLGITGGTFLGVDVANGFNQNTIYQIIVSVWNYVRYFAGVLAVFMVMYGGFTMLTATGQPQKIQASRRIITYAVIGLAGVVAIEVIKNLISIAVGAK